jgi:hypothetical protein
MYKIIIFLGILIIGIFSYQKYDLNTFMQKQSIHEPQTYYVDSLDGDDTHE